MNRTRIRVFARNRMSVKSLPIQSFRRPFGEVPEWLQNARMLTSHHPITGQLITDKETNKKILKGNQSAMDRRNNPGKDQAEVDTENTDKLVELFNMRMIEK